ncbi:MAG: N-acetyltransferase [Flavobacteriales bacterium]|nr:N-acetyltransferase [Flavobacteriales bacterium]
MDLPFILAQYNHAIEFTTAVYEYELFTVEYINKWFNDKKTTSYPVIIAEIDGTAVGFATYGQFRQRCAYKSTVEHSLYVAGEFQGKGIGKKMLQELMEIARANDVHVMIGGIDAENVNSISFHLGLGFVECGRIKEVAYKFDRWLDLVFVQKILIPLDSQSHQVFLKD